MKFFILSLLFLLLTQNSVLSIETNRPYLWISVNPFVFNILKKSPYKVFIPKKIIKQKDETLFLVHEKDLSNLSHFLHHALKRCGGYRVVNEDPIISNKIKKSFGWYDFQLELNPDYTVNNDELVHEYINSASTFYMDSIVEKLSLFPTRYYKTQSGVDALYWIGNEWKELTKHRSDITVNYYTYKSHSQPSVILTITGSDKNLKNEIIILGGHADSINTDSSDILAHAPGADDNAAGIAVISEIIRIIMEKNYRPKHTIQFIAYAAEEVGIQGSYELAKVYRENKNKVIGVLQFDGVNYKGPSYDMALIADNTNDEQNTFLAKLIDHYLKIKWTWDRCEYACSDHAAWNYEGYRASFPVEAIMSEQNPYIHTENDLFEKSSNTTDHALNFTKLGLAYLIELDQ